MTDAPRRGDVVVPEVSGEIIIMKAKSGIRQIVVPYRFMLCGAGGGIGGLGAASLSILLLAAGGGGCTGPRVAELDCEPDRCSCESIEIEPGEAAPAVDAEGTVGRGNAARGRRSS